MYCYSTTSATNLFTIVVDEVNSAPTLAALPDLQVSELALLSITNSAAIAAAEADNNSANNTATAPTNYSAATAPIGRML